MLAIVDRDLFHFIIARKKTVIGPPCYTFASVRMRDQGKVAVDLDAPGP
jgi:hypothetical protein